MSKKMILMSLLSISTMAVANCTLDVLAELQEESVDARGEHIITRVQVPGILPIMSEGDNERMVQYADFDGLVVKLKARQDYIRDGSGRVAGVSMKVDCLQMEKSKDSTDLISTRIIQAFKKPKWVYVALDKSQKWNFQINDKKKLVLRVIPR